VLRSKEYLVAVRPKGDLLALETMLFADEVVPPESLDDALPGEVEAGERELKMAKQLVESLSGPFEPEKYSDEYREARELRQRLGRRASQVVFERRPLTLPLVPVEAGLGRGHGPIMHE